MTWLSLTGLSLDIVGVMLIAWATVVATSAAHEEARPRADVNPWLLALRRREKVLVQFGVIFLVVGFTLQVAVQVVALPASGELIAGGIASAVIVVVGVVIGLRLARRNLPNHTIFEDNDDRLKDQRHVFQVATVDDWWNLLAPSAVESKPVPVATVDDWWNLLAGFVSGRHESTLREVDESRKARINHGRWLVPCPQCQNAPPGWPDNPRAICLSCGIVYSAIYPEAGDRTTIERLLLRRPQDKRNWGPEDSVKTLRAENRGYNLADD